MAAEPNCVFCKIVAGEIPSATVLRTEACQAFLDIGPLSEGHLLVIPVKHYTRMEDMPPEELAQLSRELPGLGRALVEVTGAAGYNLLQNNGSAAGQEVTHVHFHLIPRSTGDGLGYRWRPQAYPEGRADQILARYRDVLAG